MFKAEKKIIKIIIYCFFLSSNYFYCQNQKIIDSLKLMLINAKHDTTKLIAINLIGKEIQNYNLDSALFYLNLAKTEGEKLITKFPKKSKEWKYYSYYHAWTLNGIGIIKSKSNNPTGALEYYNESLKINEEIESMADIANNLINIGLLYYDKSDFSKALEYLNKSIDINEKINNKKGLGTAYYNIGSICKDQGNYLSAIDFFFKSLKMLKETGSKKGESSSLNYLGLLYQEQKEYSLALDYYSQSLKIKEEIGDKKGIGLTINNIGLIHNYLKDYEKAMIYFEKSLKIHEEIKNKKGIAIAISNIGMVKRNLEDYTGSLESYEKCLKIREEIGDIKGIISVNTQLGKLYLKQNNFLSALTYLNKSLSMAKEYGYAEDIRNAASELIEAHRALGNYNLALENLELFIKMRDSITNNETQKAAIRQSAKYEYEKQQAIAQAAFEKQQAVNQLQLKSKEALIEKNKNQLLVLEKDNQLKNLNLLQRANELKQKEIISDNQQKKLDLLDKEKKLNIIQSEKRETDLKKQRIINYSLFAGVFLISIILGLAIRAYRQKKLDNLIIQNQKIEVENQRHDLIEKNILIEEKQKEIVDSINYARRIQYTLLAHEQFLKDNLKEHFVYFNPKDIVSGDFYWATKHNNKFYLAVCDSTGHGVPGAFMSLLNIGFLSEAINEKGIEKPNEVFDFVRMKLTDTISKDGQKDGFDGILVCFDYSNKSISYAAANNTPILISKTPLANGQETTEYSLKQLPSDRMPVGIGERKQNFSLHTINYNTGDILYLYTDGYPDQFGGPKGKKFMYKQLNELILTNHSKNILEQKTEMENAFNNWKGDLEQVDDVCIIGVRI